MAKAKRILIAEDEIPIAMALSLKLKSSGYEVTHAKNGKEAVDILEKETFDIMLLDMIMPQMDGFEVLKEIKKRGIKMPVIVTSNLGQEEDKKQCKKLGAVDYIVKAEAPLYKIVELLEKKLK